MLSLKVGELLVPQRSQPCSLMSGASLLRAIAALAPQPYACAPGRASRLRRQLAACKALASTATRPRGRPRRWTSVWVTPTHAIDAPGRGIPIPYEKSLAYRYFRTRPDDPLAALSSSRSSMSSSICAHTLNTSFFDDSQSSPPTKISSRM